MTTSHMSTHLVIPRTFNHLVDVAVDLIFNTVAAKVGQDDVFFQSLMTQNSSAQRD